MPPLAVKAWSLSAVRWHMLVATTLAAASPPDDQASAGPSSAGTGIDEIFPVNIVPGLRVRVLGDETSFREAFSHFPNDELNGISPAKLERLGQEAVILNTFVDNTVTCRFDDGAQYDMPANAFALLSETGGHSPQQSTNLHARVVPSEYCAHLHARQELTRVN